ncbi:hypothetical protein P775_11720 [Puniceibacterium antarcticum]|uniref:Uncharacterized protein n=1 Tax=Puniceibacterium antarcticum TaxID=1206336 RepID=A0A2G8REL4_9RHOB|nr:hypothetical protein [Puniceibacterium antarcticum]PIL20017.1 hypothetical protein P775_11720 [Puniceibacterium antarcticum]
MPPIPTRTGHTRDHVVWQVSSYDLIALIGIYLTWTADAGGDRLWMVLSQSFRDLSAFCGGLYL